MKKNKVLFLHFDLGNGGAENVLVNLLNALDKSKYDITLRTVFSGGVNQKRLDKNIDFKPLFNRKAFKGTSIIFKLLPKGILHKLFVRDHYDYEIAFLEEIPTRILGLTKKPLGTKRYAWFHNTVDDHSFPYRVYRSKKEFQKVYSTIDKLAFVSKGSLESFEKELNIETPKEVVHNVCDFSEMLDKAQLPVNISFNDDQIYLCSVGRLCGQKGFHRLLEGLGNIFKEGKKNWHLLLIGDGPEKEKLIKLADNFNISNHITFLGFQDNPYKYVSKSDFFVCSSYKEGYSTAVTESIVVGTPVLTTNCSGMEEILGQSGAGIIVDNNLSGIVRGLKLITSLTRDEIADYKRLAQLRSKDFSKDSRVREFESFIGVR